VQEIGYPFIAVDRVIGLNEIIAYDKVPLITILHCKIYLASKF